MQKTKTAMQKLNLQCKHKHCNAQQKQAAMQKQIQDAEAAHAAAYISRHPPISTGGVSEAARQEGRNPSARTFSSYSPGNISQATSRAARGDPQGTGGGWKWAHGGMVDKTLPGRSRDI